MCRSRRTSQSKSSPYSVISGDRHPSLHLVKRLVCIICIKLRNNYERSTEELISAVLRQCSSAIREQNRYGDSIQPKSSKDELLLIQAAINLPSPPMSYKTFNGVSAKIKYGTLHQNQDDFHVLLGFQAFLYVHQ